MAVPAPPSSAAGHYGDTVAALAIASSAAAMLLTAASTSWPSPRCPQPQQPHPSLRSLCPSLCSLRVPAPTMSCPQKPGAAQKVFLSAWLISEHALEFSHLAFEPANHRRPSLPEASPLSFCAAPLQQPRRKERFIPAADFCDGGLLCREKRRRRNSHRPIPPNVSTEHRNDPMREDRYPIAVARGGPAAAISSSSIYWSGAAILC